MMHHGRVSPTGVYQPTDKTILPVSQDVTRRHVVLATYHIGQGHQQSVLGLGAFPRSGAHHVIGPFQNVVASLDFGRYKGNLVQGRNEVFHLDAFGPGVPVDERWQTFVTKGRHAHGVVIQAWQGIEPWKPGRSIAHFVQGQDLDEEQEFGLGFAGSETAEGGQGLLQRGVAAHFLQDAVRRQDHVGRYLQDGTTGRQGFGRHDVPIVDVDAIVGRRLDLQGGSALDAAGRGPFLHGRDGLLAGRGRIEIYAGSKGRR